MSSKNLKAVAYLRTSSAANAGDDKDSHRRQIAAIQRYARSNGIEVVQADPEPPFYDAAVSGADSIEARPGFVRMLEFVEGEGITLILVETASRFARSVDVAVMGRLFLKRRGIKLVAVDQPSADEQNPMAIAMEQMAQVFSELEKRMLVAKLKVARDRKRAATGRCEGPKPVSAEVISEARRLARANPKTGRRRSLRQIADELATLGHLGRSGAPYAASSIRNMLAKQPA